MKMTKKRGARDPPVCSRWFQNIEAVACQNKEPVVQIANDSRKTTKARMLAVFVADAVP